MKKWPEHLVYIEQYVKPMTSWQFYTWLLWSAWEYITCNLFENSTYKMGI